MQTGTDLSRLDDALLAAFSVNSLKRMVRRRLGITLENEVNLAQGLKYVISELVQVSVREGWSEQLVRGAILENPHPLLENFSRLNAMGVSAVPILADSLPRSANQGVLEKLIRERGGFIKWQDFVNRLNALGRHLCRIEISGSATGTGWLVGPDIILTNYHVMESLKKHSVPGREVICRFDYFNEEHSKGFTCSLAASWEIASCAPALSDTDADAPEPSDDELDYAVVRLDMAAGDELLDNGSARRGWVRLSATPPIIQGRDILLIPQHPEGRTLELAFGQALDFNTSGTRLRHDADTEPGSSGSPCLTTSLLPFAVHHASGPGKNFRYNQCVPLRKIVQRLIKGGISPFWQS